MLHDDRKINWASIKNARPPGGHFQEDRKINVASRVLTRKNAPLPGGYIFQQTGTILLLAQNKIGTNLLTKCRTINVASRVLARQTTKHCAQNPKDAHHFHEEIKYPPHGGNFFQQAGTMF
ncbi:hypothetical protein DPMN_027842 [Dreissena polymorpha]|uniref:Uncharacterized protein n=1 Tax=Dreissena polymorpha TaxID=45954 RepID=A0A9D4LTM9_DREPO|nr:hypothetical protein DPMN_027842 [Dreissena polymorpha]